MPSLYFTLTPAAVSQLHDILSCLVKFDENVSIEARKGDLRISSLNTSKTAHASFTLDALSFFTKYSFLSDVRSGSSSISLAETWSCHLQNRALLSILKKRTNDGRDKDTALERCEVNLQLNYDETTCRLVIRMICRHGVVKTYRLTYESGEVLHASFDKGSSQNYWTISSRTLRDVVEYFGPKTEQLDWFFDNGKVIFTSYTEKVQNGREILKQPIHTSVSIEKKDFEDFNVQEGLHIGIVVKDFKAIISHAETLQASVTARYSRGNRPMQVAYETGGIRSEFTLMTRGNASTVPSGSKASTPARDLSVNPIPRPVSSHTTPSIPATTQPPISNAMPPPNSSTMVRNMALQAKSSRQPSRNSPPAPSASINPDSLFIPAEEDQVWDEPNYEDEPDMVTWDAAPTTILGQRLRDSEPSSFIDPGNRAEEPLGIAPTQRLSEVKGLFD